MGNCVGKGTKDEIFVIVSKVSGTIEMSFALETVIMLS